MERLRNLQDKTGGFNAFIPLKYKKANNSMSHLGEVSIIEDLRNYAVSRIYLDNIQHIKAYWPMTGKGAGSDESSFSVPMTSTAPLMIQPEFIPWQGQRRRIRK